MIIFYLILYPVKLTVKVKELLSLDYAQKIVNFFSSNLKKKIIEMI